MKHITHKKVDRGYLKRVTPGVNLKTFWILSIFSMVLLSCFYIFQVNSVTNASRQLSLFQESIEGFSYGNENLELRLTEKEPLFNLEVLAKELEFEKIDKIQYINLTEGAVAAK